MTVWGMCATVLAMKTMRVTVCRIGNCEHDLADCWRRELSRKLDIAGVALLVGMQFVPGARASVAGPYAVTISAKCSSFALENRAIWEVGPLRMGGSRGW